MPNNYIYVAYNNVRISPHIWHYHIHGIYSYLYDNMYYLICKNCIYVTCIRNIFAHIYVHIWNTCHIFCDTVTYMTKYIWTYMSNTAYMLHIWCLQGYMHTIYGAYMYIYVACMSHICLFRMGILNGFIAVICQAGCDVTPPKFEQHV